MASAWTDEIIESMKSLYNSGASSSQIAAALNQAYDTFFAHNAVIGKLHRNGMRREADHSPQWSRPRATRKTKAPRRVNQRRSVKWTPDKGIEPVKVPIEFLDMNQDAIAARDYADSGIPPRQRKTLMQLRADDCRWPVGDPGKPGFFFCGGKKVKGLPYCGAHCPRAYQPNSARSPRPASTAMSSAPMMYPRVIDRDFEVV